MFLKSIEFTLNKFNNLVNSSKANFIVGIQPYNTLPHEKPVSPGKHKDILYSNMEILSKESESFNLNVINFTKNNEFYKFKDSIHTTQKSADLVAEKYLNYIVENFNDDLKKIIENN